MSALRRSARNVGTSSAKDIVAGSTRGRKPGKSGTEVRKSPKKGVVEVVVEQRPRRPLRNRQPTPIPTTDDHARETSEPAEPKNTPAKVVELVEKPSSEEEYKNPLEGFGDHTFSTINASLDSSEGNEPHAKEAVLAWQAQATEEGGNEVTPSSSLPPSSPPPPLSDESDEVDDIQVNQDLVPPSEDPSSMLDNTSDISDPFGFFAAEKKLKERRKELRSTAEATPPSPQPSFTQTKTPRVSLAASTLTRPAFSTPAVIPRYRSRSSSLSSVPDEGIGIPAKKARVSQGSFGADVPIGGQSKRTRSAQVRPESPCEEDDGVPHRRRTARKVSGGSSSAGGKGKKVEKAKDSQGSRRPRGAGAASARRRRAKQDEEGELIEGADDSSEDEIAKRPKRDRDQLAIARAKRIAEFKALDDYELEVEEVLF
ncbi:uncharacterized protein EI90DRAFT_3123170 [Cantharellus anzutake]|uniref:uncharacterized protein n=1 Tax=Cantharellus anzutake TaxID=1750568 RepID=UPI00190335EB|nr:uncharacterized protein EI90DRAFT_3123170 [Cantharellus anzutake]KAF8332108.1 hypothetical protein EI90DRAFT_3123170 [Cantharellus anzutake]